MKKAVKRTVSIVLCLSLVIGILLTCVACNKDKEVSYSLSDIYCQSATYSELTSYDKVAVLPTGWSVYTDSASTTSGAADENSDVGYIKELNAFIIKTTDTSSKTILSIIKLGDNTIYFDGGSQGMLFPMSVGIVAIRVKDNMIAVKYKNGDCAVYGAQANLLLSRTKVGGGASATIDNCIKILDSKLIAVHSTYDASGISGYTSIYRPTSKGDLTSRGELVAYVRNTSTLDCVEGFDNSYISVTGNADNAYMFKVPTTATENGPKKMSGGNGVLAVTSSQSDFYYEITYIGNGRFFIHTDYTCDESADYTYYDGADYYSVTRYIYNADSDTMSNYTDNADKMFMNLTSTYYDSSKADVDVNGLLNDGFIYASYCLNLFVNNDVTTGFYDQYILDSNLNVVRSLTGNYGENLTMDDRENITAFDLLMTCSEDVYYVPAMPSVVKYYDKDGNLLGQNDKYDVVAQVYSNGVAVAQIVDPEDEEEYLYGAFDKNGNVIIDFKYTSISSFRGFYTFATREDENGQEVVCLLGKDGKEYSVLSDLSEALSDIATTSSGSYICKIGCYMYKEVKDSITYYGIKNFNPNVQKNSIIPATMLAGATMYAPTTSPSDVFVFEKITATDNSVTYIIYKLK